MLEADGSRVTMVAGKPGDARAPRWSPDGHRLAFLSRRRGWTQVWLIDAPVPRRGRPATEPKPPRPSALTATGLDVDAFEWSPDGTRLAVMGHLGPAVDETAQIALVDVADGAMRIVAGERSVDVGGRWASDGSLLFVSDADGWFQVVRLTPDGHDRIVLTDGEREHGEPYSGVLFGPDPRRCPRRTPAASSTSRSTTGSRTSSSVRWREARPRSAVVAGRPRRREPCPQRRPASASTRGTASGSPSAGHRTGRGSRRPANGRPPHRTCGCCPSRAWHPRMPVRARSPTRYPSLSAMPCRRRASRRPSASQ